MANEYKGRLTLKDGLQLPTDLPPAPDILNIQNVEGKALIFDFEELPANFVRHCSISFPALTFVFEWAGEYLGEFVGRAEYAGGVQLSTINYEPTNPEGAAIAWDLWPELRGVYRFKLDGTLEPLMPTDLDRRRQANK